MMSLHPHTCLYCDGAYGEPCGECHGKGGYFCEDADCALCEAVHDELKLFRLGGHNAQTLAVNSVAKRYGAGVIDARELLKDADKARPSDA